MAAGVTIEDPATTYIDPDVDDRRRHDHPPGVSIEGGTTIGAGCEIHSGARIVDSRIGRSRDDPQPLRHHQLACRGRCVDRAVRPPAQRGDIRAKAKVGNFVEMKNTVFGARLEVESSRLSRRRRDRRTNVNIGAGTITCNYDGVHKHQTTIEDGAFIGSDSQLIAPVTVGEGAYVGTGINVREDVPPARSAVSAGQQRNIESWVDRKAKRDEASDN